MMDDYTYKRWEDRKSPLESDEWKRSPSKVKRKNLKKFCRGHEGRAHDFRLKKSSWANGRPCSPSSTRYWSGCTCRPTCTVCGKTKWNDSGQHCAEYWENARKKREADQEARIIAMRAKYHIKPQETE